MKRLLIIWYIVVVVGALVIGASCWYFFRYWHRFSQSLVEQQVIAAIAHEINSFKSLNFQSSSQLISMLEVYAHEVQKINHERDNVWAEHTNISIADAEKIDALITVNKKMLKSYMKDLQDYSNRGISTATSIVRFSYDKVVRLTIALAELEKSKIDGLALNEYFKKVGRMHEIVKQSIAHSKGVLRTYLRDGVQEEHHTMQKERLYVTKKVQQFIALDRILYL